MKKSVPISLKTLNSETIPEYVRLVGECGVSAVFLYHPGAIHLSSAMLRREPEKIKDAIDAFRECGVEVGVWVESFGHGRPLYSTADEGDELSVYTPIMGLDGKSTPYGLCPSGERFVSDYLDGIRRLAELSPDVIMLDDDLRFLRGGSYLMGCFCRAHTEDFYRRVGERVDRSALPALIFTGGKNKYRTAYMEMLRESLLAFAARVRETVDKVDPKIRVGACSVRETLDYDGTDQTELARAFAGTTKPFTRTSGAPYGGTDIIHSVEFTRLQLSRLSDGGIETLTEGDTYPRPRYNTPSKVLELYNLALSADGNACYSLDYIFDYNHKPHYELGYVERYVRGAATRRGVEELFSGKRAVGVRIYDKPRKICEWQLGDEFDENTARRIPMWSEGPYAAYVAENTVPTAFCDTGYPVLLLGENARGIDRAVLKNGAILDVTSAKILEETGVDTGLESVISNAAPACEYFPAFYDSEPDIDNGAHKKIKARRGGVTESVFLPEGTPASYTYENAEGERFLVFATDAYLGAANKNYTSSYYRQKQLVSFVESCGKPLPAVCEGCPCLYMLCSEGEDGSLAVLLINSHPDEVISPAVRLGKEYGSVKFLGCNGELSGRELRLSDIASFGFAAFELRK